MSDQGIFCASKYCEMILTNSSRLDFKWLKVTTNLDNKHLSDEFYFCCGKCAMVWLESMRPSFL